MQKAKCYPTCKSGIVGREGTIEAEVPARSSVQKKARICATGARLRALHHNFRPKPCIRRCFHDCPSLPPLRHRRYSFHSTHKHARGEESAMVIKVQGVWAQHVRASSGHRSIGKAGIRRASSYPSPLPTCPIPMSVLSPHGFGPPDSDPAHGILAPMISLPCFGPLCTP